LWRHWPGDDQRPDDLAAVHVDFQERYDWDFVKVSPSSSFCVEDLGVETVWEGLHPEGTRRYTKRAVRNPEDWSALKPLDPRKGALGRQLECLRLLGAEFEEEVPFIQTIFSPLAQAKYLSGDAQLRLNLRQNAGQIHQALATITETTLRFIAEAKNTGMAGIYYAVQYANYDRLSEAEYQVFGLPYDRRIMDALEGLWLNVLHLHGPHPMLHLLSDFRVHVVNWHDRESDPDLVTGMRQFKGAASGGVHRDALLGENPQDALDQARDAITRTGGRRFILGTGCVTMVTTPVGNIRKLRALVDEVQVPEA
jgi:uroporphyrinogen decarboxylase